MSGFRCLALETGVRAATVAACNGDRECELALPEGRKAAAGLFDAIDEALGKVGLTLRDLDCIAFGKGPGAFTGLRVAAAAAQGLGAGLGVKLCAISSLAAMAHDAQERALAAVADDPKNCAESEDAFPCAAWIAPCLPAGRDEVYIGWYQSDSDGLVSRGAEDRLVRDASCRLPGTASFIAAGSVWAERQGLQADSGSRISRREVHALPRARALLRLARRDYAEGRGVAPARAQPVYLRRAV